MNWREAAIGAALAIGVGVQAYALACCAMMLGTPSGPRSVVGNELVLLWAATAGIGGSWSAIHLLVSSCSDTPSRPAARDWARVALWSVFAVAKLALGTGLSVNLYQVGFRDTLCLIVPGYAVPALCAATTLAQIIARLRNQQIHQRQLTRDGVDAVENNMDAAPLETQVYSPPAKSLRTFDGVSLTSDMTRLGGAASVAGSAGNGAASPLPPAILVPSPHPQHCDLSIIPSTMTTLTPPPRPSRAGWIKKVAAEIARNGPLVMSAAFLSIAVQALLFSGTLEQSRHVAATPDVHGSIFAAPALFPDNVERTVNISLACHGGHSRWGPEGSPKLPPKATVLIEHVAGYPSLVSRSLHSALVAQGHRVCAYDRPGYAHTPQGYSPISPVTLERALSSSLRSVGEGGPFFVVGHRSGAEYARLFAALNRGSVIGMAFVYPTDMALLSLLGHTQSEPVRVATARAMSDSRLLPEPGLGRLHLNAQRALAALGTWLTSPPTISDTNISSQPETEWALSSPYLAQAQYFEMLQQPQLAQVIQKMDEPADMRRKLPIILLGVSADRIVQKDYLAAVASNLDVVIADPRGLQPLSLTSVARHISQHIALLH